MRLNLSNVHLVALLGVLLVVSGCKSDKQRQAEIDAQLSAHRAQLENQLRIAEIRAETERQAALLAAETKRRRDHEVMATARTIGVVGVIAAVLAAFGFWVRQVAIRAVVENQKSARFSEAMTLLTDRNSGLSDAQREALVSKAIEASNRPLLTHNPS